MHNDSRLRERIEGLTIGPADAALTFPQRLARENGWSSEFALRTIREYQRFLYLVAISKQQLTPSDEVDQAWHLHLTYTRSYWQDLCESILGFPLHHLPTEGGNREQQRFREQYQHTLTFYEQIFGEAPPPDIWPTVEKRFRDVEDFVRVNRQRCWTIPKPRRVSDAIWLVLLAPLLLVSCTDELGDTDIWFWLKVAFGIFIVYKIARWLGSAGGGRNSGGGCGACSGCGS